jgi:hypothetical protein
MRAEFSLNDVERLLGRLGAELVAVKDGATSLRCELSLDVTKPAHAQSNDAIRNLVDMLGSVLFQCFGRFHFEHDDLNLIATSASLSQPERKKSPSGAGGLELGLLIFETKTHPATVDITIGRRIRFLQSPQR